MKEYESEPVYRRMRAQTEHIQTSRVEEILVNLTTPLAFAAYCLTEKNPSYTFQDFCHFQTLGYKRMLRIQEKHNNIPKKLVKNYLKMPCGTMKLITMTIRPYLPEQ